MLLLATVLWLLATVYLSLVHRKYAHIPRPAMPRYFFFYLKPEIEHDTKWPTNNDPIVLFFFVSLPAASIWVTFQHSPRAERLVGSLEIYS